MERMEYVGPIPELQGELALVRPITEEDLKHTILQLPGDVVVAQFDNIKLTLGRSNLSYGWHPFPADHFMPVDGKPVFR